MDKVVLFYERGQIKRVIRPLNQTAVECAYELFVEHFYRFRRYHPDPMTVLETLERFGIASDFENTDRDKHPTFMVEIRPVQDGWRTHKGTIDLGKPPEQGLS